MPSTARHVEHSEQKSFVSWFRLQYSGIEIIAIPNGESRGDNKLSRVIRGKRLKDEGVVAGVWDILVPTWYLWIEMKADKKKKLTKSQEWFGDVINNHYHRIVGKGFCDAAEKTREFVKLISKDKHRTDIGERIWLLN